MGNNLLFEVGTQRSAMELIRHLDDMYGYDLNRGAIPFPKDMPYGLAYIGINSKDWTIAFNTMPSVGLIIQVFSFFFKAWNSNQKISELIFKYNSLEPKIFKDLKNDFDYGSGLKDVIGYLADENYELNKEEENRLSREAGENAQIASDWQDRF